MHLTEVVNFLNEANEIDAAKNLLKTFEKYAVSIVQYDEIGMLYQKVKAYHDSLRMLEKCNELVSDPIQKKAVKANMAKVYNHLNEPLKSIECSEYNLKLNPNDYEARMEKAFSYYLYGDSEISYKIQNELLEDPNLPIKTRNFITFNMGTFDMQRGDYKNGLRKTIMKGKEIGLWKPVKVPYIKWDGKPTDKELLVYAEAGIGDEIINIRFMKHIKEMGIKAYWVGHRKYTNDLFRRNGYDVISLKDIDPTKKYVYAEAMTLPIVMGLDKGDFWKGSYLTPDEKYVEKWRQILPERFTTLKWSGNPLYDQDLHRSVDLKDLIELAKYINLPYVSLQIDDNKYSGDNIINVDIESWEDTLAIQYLAEINITSCTSTAHSASAIGAKTYVLPPICTYYPWISLKEDNSSYWYSDMTKVFAQTKHRDWSDPINKIKELEKKRE